MLFMLGETLHVHCLSLQAVFPGDLSLHIVREDKAIRRREGAITVVGSPARNVL